jgi:hypothetical protein
MSHIQTLPASTSTRQVWEAIVECCRARAHMCYDGEYSPLLARHHCARAGRLLVAVERTNDTYNDKVLNSLRIQLTYNRALVALMGGT